MSSSSAQDNEQKKNEWITELKKLQEPAIFQPEKSSDTEEDDFILMLLEKIPFINGLLQRINASGRGVDQIKKSHDHTLNKTSDVMLFTSNAGLALNIIDFLTIPLIYIAAFTLGKKIPFTLENNAKWLYASIGLALGITALILTAAAPFIAVALAGLSFSVSVGSLGMVLYQRAQDRKAIIGLIELIENTTETLHDIHEQAKALEQKLSDCPSNDIHRLKVEIDELNARYQLNTSTIQSLYNEKNKLEEQVISESNIINRCADVALASLVVIGAVVSLFFPPVGVSILATAAIIGGVYTATPFVVAFGKWLFGKADVASNNNQPSQQSQLHDKTSTQNIVAHLATQENKKSNELIINNSELPAPDSQFAVSKTIEHDTSLKSEIQKLKASDQKKPDEPDNLTPTSHH